MARNAISSEEQLSEKCGAHIFSEAGLVLRITGIIAESCRFGLLSYSSNPEHRCGVSEVRHYESVNVLSNCDIVHRILFCMKRLYQGCLVIILSIKYFKIFADFHKINIEVWMLKTRTLDISPLDQGRELR